MCQLMLKYGCHASGDHFIVPDYLCPPIYQMDLGEGGVRSTVVDRWTAGQHVKRSILHQGHDSQPNSSLAQVVPSLL